MMIPVGYMAKRVSKKPKRFDAPQVKDIYSVSGCISPYFADYIPYWAHNGYWLFNTPEDIQRVARENAINLGRTSLFYYEAYEQQFDGSIWSAYAPEPWLTSVITPIKKRLEGFDVVSFSSGNAPECSPLSCNCLAKEIRTNSHCLLASYGEAEAFLIDGQLCSSEPGPYRIFAVYSVDWP